MSPHGDAVFQPARRGLAALRKAASACRGCDLYAHATQTVFGEGARRARVVLVGEQPGNDEDLAGTPFVGPAGRVLDEALQAAGPDRDRKRVVEGRSVGGRGSSGCRRIIK